MVQGPIGIKDAAPEDIAGKYFNIAANTAGVQVKGAAGVFLGVNVNTAGTGAATITLYDGTSTAGPVIGIFSTLAVSVIDANPIAFTTGLFAAVAGTTSGNVTVVYV
jgi:hypothetical protein